MPKSDEEILAYTVNGPPSQYKIQICDYDPNWPRFYERECRRIESVLSHLSIKLEHVGSTSVPNLAAKPIIDILLILPDSSNESAYLPQMEAAGYILRVREPDWYEHRVFKGPDHDINLHVFSEGCIEIERMLLFRNWLRSYDEDRLLYESTKKELASKNWKFVQNYADAKTEVVEQILKRARA